MPIKSQTKRRDPNIIRKELAQAESATKNLREQMEVSIKRRQKLQDELTEALDEKYG